MDVPTATSATWNRALSIFGAEQKTLRWFRTRLSELNYRTPEEVLNDDPGSEAVDAILDRIDYGVFS